MADPSVTNTFADGDVADADQVNTNFTDILTAIRSASTADLGCGSLKIATVPFASAVVSAIAGATIAPTNVTASVLTVVNTFTAGNAQITSGITAATITADNGIFTSANVGGVSIASAAISQIVAYDFTDIVENEMSYASGTFTAVVSGLTSAGNPVDAIITYQKVKDIVTLVIPAVRTTDDGSGSFDYTGLPDVICPSVSAGCAVVGTISQYGWLNGNSEVTSPLGAIIQGSYVTQVQIKIAGTAWGTTGNINGPNCKQTIIYSTRQGD